MKLEGNASKLIACHFTFGISRHPGGLQEHHVIGGTMKEVTREVQTLAKARPLVVSFIPRILVGFETYEAPKIGVVEVVCIPTLARINAPVGIGGTVETTK